MNFFKKLFPFLRKNKTKALKRIVKDLLKDINVSIEESYNNGTLINNSLGLRWDMPENEYKDFEKSVLELKIGKHKDFDFNLKIIEKLILLGHAGKPEDAKYLTNAYFLNKRLYERNSKIINEFTNKLIKISN
jgi:hypothetical protein